MARTVGWGHWGLYFYDESGACAGMIAYPVGPAGPINGTVGSPERKGLERAAIAWVKSGRLPMQGAQIGEVQLNVVTKPTA